MSKEKLVEFPVDGELDVESETIVVETTDFNKEEFKSKLKTALRENQLWRTASALGDVLGVDSNLLEEWMLKQSNICNRLSTSSKRYFALVERIDELTSTSSSIAATDTVVASTNITTAETNNKATAETNNKATAETNKGKVKKAQQVRQLLVSEEERYAFAFVHFIHKNLDDALSKYALRIAQRDPEAFAHFTKALNSLNSGCALYSKKIGVNESRLPKIS